MREWISVEENLPESSRRVLARSRRSNGISVTIVAQYIASMSVLCDEHYSDDICLDWETVGDYDENSDEWYKKAGWVESIENWDEFSQIDVISEITHWMPLPEPPKSNTGKGG